MTFAGNLLVRSQPQQGTVVLNIPMTSDFNDVTGRHTVTTNGNVVISNDLGSPWGKFNGSGDFLSIPDSPDFSWDEAFTLEVDIYKTKTTRSFVFSHRADGTNSHGIDIEYTSGNNNVFVAGVPGMNPISTSLVTIAENTAYSIALCYTGTDFKFVVDGVVKTTVTTAPVSTDVNATFYIGRIAAATSLDWGGYMRNFKITKGVSLY